MTSIDRSKPVLVTGATGYVAGWIVKYLLDEGMTVHATVRNPQDTEKLAHLQALAKGREERLRFFRADLLQEGSFAEAMQGCELVYHTASPFTSNYKDARKELIEPAVRGTENVLQQAIRTPSVKRVVLTSSCAAIYTDASETLQQPLTEQVWNTTASENYQPYSYSKTLAERKAWEIAQGQQGWDLVVLNPSLVMGPALDPQRATSESIHLLRQLGDGTLRFGAPELGIGIVDVRDLAEAHLQAGLRPQAQGRYIVSGHSTTFLQAAKTLLPQYGNRYPLPRKALPKWLLLLVGPFVNKAMTRDFVRNNVDVPWKADNSKGVRELGIEYRPLTQTMNDAFASLLEGKAL